MTTTVNAVSRIHMEAHASVYETLNRSLAAEDSGFAAFLADNEMLVDLPIQDVIAQYLGRFGASDTNFSLELRRLELQALNRLGWERRQLRRRMALARLQHSTADMGITPDDYGSLWHSISEDLDLAKPDDVTAVHEALNHDDFDSPFGEYIRQKLAD